MADEIPDIKQVIVMRRDLKMRRGKEIAQGAHASLAFLTEPLATEGAVDPTPVQWQWISGSFKKICLQVDSEAELLAIQTAARGKGIECHLVTDSGLTEFNGVPTKTCLALGPDLSSKIDEVTGHLELY